MESSKTKQKDGLPRKAIDPTLTTQKQYPEMSPKPTSGTHSTDGPAKQHTTAYVVALSFFAAIGGFLFGYDTGVVSGAMLLLKDEFNLSSVWQEIIVSVTIGSAFVSALVGGVLNDRLGRKPVTLIASFVFTGGAVLLGFAENKETLVAGRLILGIGIGFASMTVPMYIAESAPIHLRGRLVTVNNLFITGGQFTASVACGGLSYVKPGGWRYMLGIAGVPSAIQFIGFFFLPESPRWLMRKGHAQKARVVLEKLRGTSEVEAEMKEMQDDNDADDASANKDGLTIFRILRTPPVRRALLVGCGLQLFQQLSGVNTVMYYSATIITMAGVGDTHTAIWLSALTASLNFLFTILGVWLVERIGRKKLIMGSLVGVTLSLVLLAVAFQLAAFNSPPISFLDAAAPNSSYCSSYTNCEACIEDDACGFCFTGSGGSANGTCVRTSPADDGYSEYGACSNETLPEGVTWAKNYCPTDYSWMAIFGLCLYLVFFAPGMGPMPWTINSEIHPLWARSTGNALSAATNWISNLLVSMTFLTLTEKMTKYGTYWLFVGICVTGLVFFAVLLPETKGVGLEEAEKLFQKPWCGGGNEEEEEEEEERKKEKRRVQEGLGKVNRGADLDEAIS